MKRFIILFVFALTATISMAQREYKMVVPFEVKLGVNPEVDFQILESHNYSLQQTQEGRGVIAYAYKAQDVDRLITLLVKNNKVLSVQFAYQPDDADSYKVGRMYTSIHTYITQRLKYTLKTDKGFTYFGKKVYAVLEQQQDYSGWNEFHDYILFQVVLKE